MESSNYIAILSSNIDVLASNFVASSYSAFAQVLTPVAIALFILYLIIWGFRFWQGHGDGRITSIVLKLSRVAMIFALATHWSPFQLLLYRALSTAPYVISSIMLSKIVNPRSGQTLDFNGISTDLFTFYEKATIASIRIEKSSSASLKLVPAPAPEDGEKLPPPQPLLSPLNTPDSALLSEPLASSIQGSIIWISAILFVGCAVSILLFAKMALAVILALAPLFIVMLLFHVSSTYFLNWLAAVVHAILVPIFLSVFLSFYLVSIQDIVIGLIRSMDNGGIPSMKDVAPFVLVCFLGLFFLVQIVPFTARIVSSGHAWARNALDWTGDVTRNSVGTHTGTPSRLSYNTTMNPAPGSLGMASTPENSFREIQERNAAITRQRRTR